jgi:TonB family protein
MRTIAVTAFAFLVAGCFGGGPRHVSNAAVGRYGHHLHDVFYEAWSQPTTVAAPSGKISVPVDIQIDKSGRVVKFQIARSSGDPAIDDSIAAVARKIGKVDPPPVTSRNDRYDLRIYFELDVK